MSSHNRFHNDPGYRDLRMLEKSTKKFLAHNFLRSANTFISYLPSSPSCSQLPTNLMARHAALQLYGAAALQLGVVGRLWSIARHLILTIHEAFSPLRALVTLLPGEEIGNPLPETLESFLPEDCNTEKCENIKKDL